MSNELKADFIRNLIVDLAIGRLETDFQFQKNPISRALFKAPYEARKIFTHLCNHQKLETPEINDPTIINRMAAPDYEPPSNDPIELTRHLIVLMEFYQEVYPEVPETEIVLASWRLISKTFAEIFELETKGHKESGRLKQKSNKEAIKEWIIENWDSLPQGNDSHTARVIHSRLSKEKPDHITKIPTVETIRGYLKERKSGDP